MRILLSVMLAGSLAACAASPARQPSLTLVNVPTEGGPLRSPAESIIGPSDILSVVVFQVPELTHNELPVDTSGRIQLPLLGAIQAAGLTAPQLAEVIRYGLASRYLQNPQVTVRITKAASQKITVDGAVTEPGVFEMSGRTTLLQAVAMAKGATITSDLESVAVFRNIDNQRSVAVFDLAAIRRGEAEDPVLQGDDIIVVDTSRLKTIMREMVAVLPALAIFRAY